MGNFPTTMRGRAWMATVQIENMRKLGLSKEEYENAEILGKTLCSIWNNSGKNRTCAVVVCESVEGLYHAHMALYGNTTTLKAVADVLYQSHIEPQLGGKKELVAYLLKSGEHAEKGEKVLFNYGIENIKDNKGSRNDLEVIEEMLFKGMTPNEILDTNFAFYKFEKMILSAYIHQRIKEAPRQIDIVCEYHVGESGTGKTYFYNSLCDEFGEEKVYLLTDYDNNASGGLDSYLKTGAPPILFMDEFKGLGISYGKLLTMLNGYTRMQTHSRYANTYNLWERVIITSVYPPEAIYQNMVTGDLQNQDSYQQLLRRISKVVYHYIENGIYKSFEIEGSQYKGYEDLKEKVQYENRRGFNPLSQQEQAELPFKEEENE